MSEVAVLDAHDPTPAQAEHAHEVADRILRNHALAQRIWVQLAADLYEFHQGKLWRALGHDTVEDWLASPEVKFSRRWAYEQIQVYAETVVAGGVPAERLAELDASKVSVVLPAVRRGHVKMDRALADAEALSRTDLRERYQGAAARPSPNGKVPDDRTSYDAEAEPDYVSCPMCRSRVSRDRIAPLET